MVVSLSFSLADSDGRFSSLTLISSFMPKMDVSRIMAFKLWRSSPDGLASNTDQAMAMRLRDLKTIKHQVCQGRQVEL